MQQYAIITDSSCDLTQEMADQLELQVAPLSVRYKAKEYANYLDGRELNIHEFYEGLRAGEQTSTTAANPEQWAELMKPELHSGKDVLVLAFSSGLSNTYNAARIAAGDLQQQYPDRKILVVDTLCASLGQGMLVYLTCKQRQEGKSIEEAWQFAEDTKLHLCHWFTVDDLYFLKRGGRISGTTAMVGSLLQIKPVMHVDDAGHLVPVSKARGRKASIMALLDHMVETAVNPEEQTIFISHGDCLEEVEELAQKIKQTLHVKEVVINHVGPVIGSHSGPGTVALFFVGTHR